MAVRKLKFCTNFIDTQVDLHKLHVVVLKGSNLFINIITCNNIKENLIMVGFKKKSKNFIIIEDFCVRNYWSKYKWELSLILGDVLFFFIVESVKGLVYIFFNTLRELAA